MKPLFYKTAQTKVAATTTKVGPRASDWGKEVLNRFYSDFPELGSIGVQLKFKDKDQDRGYAVGAIRVSNMVVPVIIRDFQLYPMDVAISGDNVIPFTTETIQMMLSAVPPFSQLSTEEDPDVYLRFFDTSYGFGTGTVMEKGSSILDYVEEVGLCTDDFKEKVAEIISTDVSLVASSPALVKSLKKIAGMTDNMDKLAEAVIPFDVYYVYEEPDGTYTKLAGSSEFDVHETIRGLEYYQVRDFPRMQCAETEKIASFDSKIVKTEGYVYRLSNDENILLDKVGNYRILVGKDYAFTKTAEDHGNKLRRLVKLAALPAPGDTGFFFDPTEGTLKSSIVEMRKVACMPNTLTTLSGEFSIGAHLMKFASLRGLKTAKPSESDGVLYIPESWAFAKLGQELPETALNTSVNPKVAALECVRCIGLDHYDFRGPVLRKYAHVRDLWEVSAHKAAFAVLQCGGDFDDVQKIAELRPGEVHVIKSVLHMPKNADSYVNAAQTKLAEAQGNEEYIFDTYELIKLSAELGSPKGVDAVLGSAFLKKDTIKYFYDSLPMFEDTLSLLAKMLLYVRMGTEALSEDSIKRAMEHLSKVIFELRGIKNLDKVR